MPAPVSANAENTLIGSPANHSRVPMMIAMVIVVDRFGSRMIRRQISRPTGNNGISSSFSGALSRRRDASRCAPHTQSATFTSSDGCTDSPEMTNQRRAPWLSVPTPGISTSASSTVVITIRGAAIRRNNRTGSRNVR